ncbi:hypothetical protein GCM10011586_39570 [Silvibacterium dinghuense]|nr:hypothetical protein GCM10011586_39570 [Silvibacterium dinghuense]
MMIPNGGGLAAAGVMHHKVYELTVEFHDARGAYHAAVFLLPGGDATRVLDSYTQAVPAARHEAAGTDAVSTPTSQDSSLCGSTDSHNVLVAAPVWSQAEVPAAYRALVYEHIVDRLQRVEGVGHVYRAGERSTMSACPRYTVAISVVSFKPGSQVIRAATGPIGFFAGTTQMIFNVQITDGAGGLHANEQIKASARGESESRNVADAVAKKLAKSYATSIKQYEKSKPAVSEQHSSPLAPS